MVKRLLVLSTFLLIIGCIPRFALDPQIVEVPVPVVVPPPVIERPILPISTLTEADYHDYNIIVKAYVISIKLLQEYARELEIALNVYRNTTKPTEEQ